MFLQAIKGIISRVTGSTGGPSNSTLLNGLFSWWDLEASSGSEVDSHRSNLMTQVGTIASVIGKVGNARDFDPNEHFYSVESVNGGDNDWTVCFWFNPDLIASADVMCCSGTYNSGSISGYNFSIDLTGGDSVILSVSVASIWQTVALTPTISVNNWYFLHAYYDSVTNTLGLQLDDNAADEITVVGTPNDAVGARLMIGAQRTGYGGFNGTMDSVGCWNRLLSSQEVAELYNAGNGVSYNDLFDQSNTLFLANFDATHSGADCVNYVADIGSDGTGAAFGSPFDINDGYVDIKPTWQSSGEQGLIWPHVDFGTDYDIEVRLCVFINTVQGGQNLQFASSNANADDAIMFGLNNGNAALWVTGGGLGSISNPYTFVDDNSTWYKLKVEVRNQTATSADVELFVDDEQGGGFVSQGTASITGHNFGGTNNKIGPRTWYTTGGYGGMPIYDYIKVTSPSATPSYLLDTYPSRVGFSVRQLLSTATNCLRVRRASDNSEQDIGFVDGGLDTASLETFCSATDGFVTTWYDQSGNGADFVQATTGNQPQIVSSGSTLLLNGKPRLVFDGSTDHMTLSGETFVLSTRTWSLVAKQDAQGIDDGMFSFKPNGGVSDDWRTNSSFVFQSYNAANGQFYAQGGSAPDYIVKSIASNGAVPHGHYMEVYSSLSGELFQDNVSQSTDTNAGFVNNTEQLILGCRWQSGSIYIANSWDGDIQELIYWESDLDADRADIHQDVSGYFGTP